VVGGLHLVDPGEDHPAADDIMGDIGTVLDRGVVPDIAGDDGAAADPRGNPEVVMLEENVPHNSQPDKAVKAGIPDKGGIKGIAYQKIIPGGTVIFVLYQDFYLLGF
jgi:hypothetical protein